MPASVNSDSNAIASAALSRRERPSDEHEQARVDHRGHDERVVRREDGREVDEHERLRRNAADIREQLLDSSRREQLRGPIRARHRSGE